MLGTELSINNNDLKCNIVTNMHVIILKVTLYSRNIAIICLLKPKLLPSQTQNAICSSAETEAAQLLHRVLRPLHLLSGLVHHVLDIPLTGSLWSRHLLKSGIFEHFSPEPSRQVCVWWLLGDTRDPLDI